jgi:hypothetical protein
MYWLHLHVSYENGLYNHIHYTGCPRKNSQVIKLPQDGGPLNGRV